MTAAFLTFCKQTIRARQRRTVAQIENLWRKCEFRDKKPNFSSDSTKINVSLDDIYKFERGKTYKLLL